MGVFGYFISQRGISTRPFLGLVLGLIAVLLVAHEKRPASALGPLLLRPGQPLLHAPWLIRRLSIALLFGAACFMLAPAARVAAGIAGVCVFVGLEELDALLGRTRTRSD